MTIPVFAAPETGILVRSCSGQQEFAACVRLQAEVWGWEERDLIPDRSFVVALHTGGQVIGAFDISARGAGPKGGASSLIGFAMSMAGLARSSTGAAPGLEPYLHSHMLALRFEYRNRGIGRRLKLFQREDALARGIQRIEWTFDPLEIKNSFLNIVKLGTMVRRYSQNFYGVSSSRLQGVLPSDRLHAEWQLESQRTRCALDGKPLSPQAVERTITVPRAISNWRHEPGKRQLAFSVQSENRRQFEESFAAGLVVLGFVMDTEGNGIFQLSRCPEST